MGGIKYRKGARTDINNRRLLVFPPRSMPYTVWRDWLGLCATLVTETGVPHVSLQVPSWR